MDTIQGRKVINGWVVSNYDSLIVPCEILLVTCDSNLLSFMRKGRPRTRTAEKGRCAI